MLGFLAECGEGGLKSTAHFVKFTWISLLDLRVGQFFTAFDCELVDFKVGFSHRFVLQAKGLGKVILGMGELLCDRSLMA
ncbi:MAG: hypothetical protein HC800_08280 [Phormidesmis sp. RL_2_1]|nr:hypothetical protein [Phormidesmis sp. RL_2_1]